MSQAFKKLFGKRARKLLMSKPCIAICVYPLLPNVSSICAQAIQSIFAHFRSFWMLSSRDIQPKQEK